MRRHFTATAIILRDRQVLLIEHRKLNCLLPPGGHIEPNEDPVQAVRREVREEVGLEVELIGEPRFEHPAIDVVQPPFTILVEPIADPIDGDHQHIDFIYVAQPSGNAADPSDIEYGSYQWVRIDELDSVDTPPELPDLVHAADRYATTILATEAP